LDRLPFFPFFRRLARHIEKSGDEVIKKSRFPARCGFLPPPEMAAPNRCKIDVGAFPLNSGLIFREKLKKT
jgi:hypothetical protein